MSKYWFREKKKKTDVIKIIDRTTSVLPFGVV